MAKKAQPQMPNYKDWIRDEIYAIPGVESVYMSTSDGVLDVWIVIADRDLDLIRQINRAERKVIQRLLEYVDADEFPVDFHTVYRVPAIEFAGPI